MKELFDDNFMQVRSIGVNFYVLRDSDGLYLIDGGFIGGRSRLEKALQERGWEDEPILGILLTHGHLDHVLNVAKIVEEHGSWIAAPRLDAARYQGRPVYRGVARMTGVLESLGRFLFRYRVFTPDRLLDDGNRLDIWDGLTVVHLPGHTEGHSGFYCQKRKMLFCGDLFASFKSWSHLPPRIFNSDGKQIPKSVAKALELELEGVLPNHGDQASPQRHLERLREIFKKLQ